MNKEVYDEFNQPVYRQQLPTGLSLQMIPMHLIYSENLVLIQMPLQVLPKQATSFLLPIMFGKV